MAIKLKPDLCESYLMRATAFARKGEVARQRADLETAAKMERNCQIIALNSLAWLLDTTPNASMRTEPMEFFVIH